MSFPETSPPNGRVMMGQRPGRGAVAVMIGLEVLGRRARLADLRELTGMSEQYMRNVISELKKSGRVVSTRSAGYLGFLGMRKQEGELRYKEATYVLVEPLYEIIKKQPSIIDTVRESYPEVSTLDDLSKLIDEKKKQIRRIQTVRRNK